MICYYADILFANESQYITTWTIFSHMWIPCAATGSSSTHLVLQKCRGKISQPVSLIWISLLAGDSSNIFHIACKTLLISQSVSIGPVCRAPCHTWAPELPMLINLENSFCSLLLEWTLSTSHTSILGTISLYQGWIKIPKAFHKGYDY